MLTKINYQKELDKLIDHLQKEEKVPTLLLHSCCAPCSSYVLEYLSSYFKITVLYYNPNIYPESEYSKRIIEQQTLIGEMDTKYPVQFIAGGYDKEKFYEMAKGLEKVKERITDALEKTLSVDYDKNRLEQELIYYIEKLDVNEEKQRLSNHLKYFISTMESGNGQGKKLGFIAQEMGREINTLGSKSNHAEMQKIVVQMKDELEQIKEQVLNVM